MLLVSPHLDDAVFSCGVLLSACPGSCVITIFAGTPADQGLATDWDRRCGFSSAGEAMEARRREDATALGMLGADHEWLGFCDSQYEEAPDKHAVARALRGAIEARPHTTPRAVLLPLGLFHSDHRLAHAAGMLAVASLRPAAARSAAVRVIAYEDSPYRGMKGMLQRRLAELGSDGIVATPVDVPCDQGRRAAGSDHLEAKRAALAAYASQLRAFGEGGYDDAWRPERFWALESTLPAADG